MHDAKIEAATAPLLDIKSLLRQKAASLAQELVTTDHSNDDSGAVLRNIQNDSPKDTAFVFMAKVGNYRATHHIPQEFIIQCEL
jgi:hypothetical protein